MTVQSTHYRPSPRTAEQEGADSLAVVTVSYYSGSDLPRCLASVEVACGTQRPVYVVNNAPEDDLTPVVAPRPNVSVIETGANVGYGLAVNRAVEFQASDVEWILVTNPDVQFAPGSVDELLAAARNDAAAAVLGPRVRGLDGSVYPSARDLPSLWGGLGHALLHNLWPTNPWSRGYLRSDKAAAGDLSPVPAGWLSGACMLLRRSAFDAVGGFDRRFFMYFEDVDLCERLSAAGWRVLYVPRAEVVHAGATSTAREADRMRAAHHRSAYLYLAKRYSRWYHLPLRWALRAGLALRSGLGR